MSQGVVQGLGDTTGKQSDDAASLAYVILYVSDVPKAVSFYECAFGLKSRRTHPQWSEMETGSTTLAFTPISQRETDITGGVQKGDMDEPRQNVEISFSVNDIEASYKRALQAGAKGLADPEKKPWGRVEAYVRDLDGIDIRIGTHMTHDPLSAA
eukprot:TRINITY_DN1426_c0_g1_i1.p1 TRINITY_DN1426_c0_g1~~TRINITY_DN1426_c0_g1_i1.p1  ORF type:complete len:172 (-),score=36.16 TRINITY_DN1426_c0_g1_i1:589-1053(-)